VSTPYSLNFITNLNSLYGTHVKEVYKLTIHEDPVVEFRYTNNDDGVTFLGEAYEAIFLTIPGLSEGSIANPATVAVTVVNTDLRLSNFFNNYWLAYLLSGNIQPLWTVKIWLINPENPDDTPIDAGMDFEVESIQNIGLPSSTLNLRPRYMAQDRLVPKQVYTREQAPFL
jgi:hypothetical protein